MLKKTGIFFLLVFAVIFQQSFLANFFTDGGAENFILMALAVFSAVYGFEKAWKAAILGGLLTDIFLFLPVGTSSFSFLAATFAAAVLAKRFLVGGSLWRFPVLLCIVAAGIVVDSAAAFLASKLFAAARGGASSAVHFSFAGLLSELWQGAIVFSLAYWPAGRIKKYLAERNNFRAVKLKYQ